MEKALIGSLLVKPANIVEVVSILQAGDFYDRKHGIIYQGCIDIFSKTNTIDIGLLSSHFKENKHLEFVGGTLQLSELMEKTPSASNAVHYARIVKEKSVRRSLRETARKIFQQAEVGEMDDIVQAFTDIAQTITGQEESPNTEEMFLEIAREQKAYEEMRKQGKDLLGYSTGFGTIDMMTEGLRKGKFWIVGGNPGGGKTTFAINVMDTLITQQVRPLFFSLEMDKTSIALRIIGKRLGLNEWKILKGKLSEAERQAVDEEKKRLNQSGMLVYKKPHSIQKIITIARAEIAMKRADAIFVDYAQMIDGGKKETVDNMNEVALSLQSLAGELNVPIMLISQLNNESRKTHSSFVSGFKGSGTFEQAADVGIVLRSPEENKEPQEKETIKEGREIEAHFMKVRNGRTGVVKLDFLGDIGLFRELLDGF